MFFRIVTLEVNPARNPSDITLAHVVNVYLLHNPSIPPSLSLKNHLKDQQVTAQPMSIYSEPSSSSSSSAPSSLLKVLQYRLPLSIAPTCVCACSESATIAVAYGSKIALWDCTALRLRPNLISKPISRPNQKKTTPRAEEEVAMGRAVGLGAVPSQKHKEEREAHKVPIPSLLARLRKSTNLARLASRPEGDSGPSQPTHSELELSNPDRAVLFSSDSEPSEADEAQEEEEVEEETKELKQAPRTPNRGQAGHEGHGRPPRGPPARAAATSSASSSEGKSDPRASPNDTPSQAVVLNGSGVLICELDAHMLVNRLQLQQGYLAYSSAYEMRLIHLMLAHTHTSAPSPSPAGVSVAGSESLLLWPDLSGDALSGAGFDEMWQIDSNDLDPLLPGDSQGLSGSGETASRDQTSGLDVKETKQEDTVGGGGDRMVVECCFDGEGRPLVSVAATAVLQLEGHVRLHSQQHQRERDRERLARYARLRKRDYPFQLLGPAHDASQRVLWHSPTHRLLAKRVLLHRKFLSTERVHCLTLLPPPQPLPLPTPSPSSGGSKTDSSQSTADGVAGSEKEGVQCPEGSEVFEDGALETQVGPLNSMRLLLSTSDEAFIYDLGASQHVCTLKLHPGELCSAALSGHSTLYLLSKKRLEIFSLWPSRTLPSAAGLLNPLLLASLPLPEALQGVVCSADGRNVMLVPANPFHHAFNTRKAKKQDGH